MGASEEAVAELAYLAKRNGLYVAGKNAAVAVGTSIGAALGHNIVGLSTVGMTAALSSGLCELDYIHKCKNLRDMYREEIQARTGMPGGKITHKDLKTLAASNHTIDEEMKKIRRQRNFGVVFSFVASLASLAIVMFALPAALHGLNIPVESLGHAGHFVLETAVALVSYNALKKPLHWLGDKLFDLDEVTTHDRIVEIKKERQAGKVISKEQVLACYVSANKQLDAMVTGNFGATFDKLPPAQKRQAVELLEQTLPLDKLVKDINENKINATELVFAVQGEVSGVRHTGQEKEKRTLAGKVYERITNLVKPRQPEVVDRTGIELVSPAHKQDATVAVYDEKRGRSFVKDMGLEARGEKHLSAVQRLEKQAAAAAAIAEQGPTGP